MIEIERHAAHLDIIRNQKGLFVDEIPPSLSISCRFSSCSFGGYAGLGERTVIDGGG
jgi:hypothetical protein